MELFRIWLGMFAMDFLRYALAAGGAFLVFWVWLRPRFRRRHVSGTWAEKKRMRHDVRWSMCTVLIFSLFGLATWFGAQRGVIQSYTPIDRHGWVWFIASVVVLVVLQDAYFYWTHRAMHHPRIFRAVHRLHHLSVHTSPFTAYAFAPLEAIVHALFVPLVWMVLPIHEVAMGLFLLIMVTRNVLGHLSIELFPPGFAKSRWLGWSTTTTHHALHHRRPATNFGFYFTFWDRIAGTTDPDYEASYERITA